MTFDEILDQVIVLLKRQGRVSYPALKIRYNLEDDYLEALKAEILDVHPVIDDEGRGSFGLVKPKRNLPPLPLNQLNRKQDTKSNPPEVEPPPTEPCPREAERRQLTVMFCDLVGSTKLSAQLDPEDYRDMVRAYQNVCTEVIQRFDGYVAQLLGDGLLVYFGYPHAHEDDAHRAVQTGLGILDAMEDLRTRLKQEKGIQLAVRLGIHTGLVVVGEMGEAGRQEQLALGEVPNIAARIQGLAQPNTLVSVNAPLA